MGRTVASFGTVACVALVASSVVPTSALGQVLRGTIVHSDSVSPAQGVLVEARTQKSGPFRTLTDARGAFSIPLPVEDSVSVRVLRIGFRPTESPTYFVPTQGGTPVRVVLDNTPYHMSTVNVLGESRCGNRADAAGWLRWEQALTVFRTVDLTQRDSSLRFRSVEYEGPTSETGVTRINSDSVLQLVPAVGQAPEAHYDSLFQRGFVRQNRGDSAMTYYAPDARLLADDRFAPGYCFRALPTSDSLPGVLGIAFEPVARRRVTDVDGTIWLDRASLELRRIEFQYRQLPQDHNITGPGGYVDFIRLATGHWIVNEWMIRMAQLMHPLERCNINWRGVYVAPPTKKGGCVYLVRTRFGLWGRSQIVASVLKGGERLYFDPYAETLAQRAEAARKPPEF
jgi:hypothetical protein